MKMNSDMIRELQKAKEALQACQRYLSSYSESMAALHCAQTTHFSPLYSVVTSAIDGIDLAISRYSEMSESTSGMLAAVLLDLDRCIHGRHDGDPCFDCEGGVSLGNRIIPPGTVLGHGLSGPEDLIVMPSRGKKHDLRAWRPNKEDGG
jgi:hypothetical protein